MAGHRVRSAEVQAVRLLRATVLGDDPVLRGVAVAAYIQTLQDLLRAHADPVDRCQHRHVHRALPDRRHLAVTAIPAGCLGPVRAEPG